MVKLSTLSRKENWLGLRRKRHYDKRRRGAALGANDADSRLELRFFWRASAVFEEACVAQSPHHIYTHIMIQRSILRQSRALCLRSSHSSKGGISRSYHQPPRIPLPQARIASRCYSTATEAESGEKIGSTEPDVQNGDQAKKELEAKDKEIIELKVRPFACPLQSVGCRSPLIRSGQIPPLSGRLPQPPRPHQTRNRLRKSFRHHPVRR